MGGRHPPTPDQPTPRTATADTVPGVAMITGAGGDIGRATAVLLAAQGWHLALVDHPGAAASLTQSARCCEDIGATVWSTTFDVADEAAVRAGVARCVVATGTPTALFNNAGRQGEFARVDRIDLAAAADVLAVNVTGALHVLSVVAAAMVEKGVAGAIVCSASMAGVTGAPNMAAYSASKAAVIGLVKAAAKDLAPAGIRVNAVAPAFIGPGRMWESQVAAQAATPSPYYGDDPAVVADEMLARVPLRRLGSPDEVAAVVGFLVSPAASYLTGITVEVAGGAA